MFPDPVAAIVFVKATGFPPEQIVSLDPIVLGVMLLMLTVNTADVAVQGMPFKVLVTVSW